MTYAEMYDAALEALENVADCPTGIPLPQATVLLGASGELYVSVNDLMGAVCRKLTENGETAVTAMLTVWQDGVTDLSSYNFRRSLLAWNTSCAETLVVLGQAPDLHTHTLDSTMR